MNKTLLPIVLCALLSCTEKAKIKESKINDNLKEWLLKRDSAYEALVSDTNALKSRLEELRRMDTTKHISIRKDTVACGCITRIGQMIIKQDNSGWAMANWTFDLRKEEYPYQPCWTVGQLEQIYLSHRLIFYTK
jgi:hypothetical protein